VNSHSDFAPPLWEAPAFLAMACVGSGVAASGATDRPGIPSSPVSPRLWYHRRVRNSDALAKALSSFG